MVRRLRFLASTVYVDGTHPLASDSSVFRLVNTGPGSPRILDGFGG